MIHATSRLVLGIGLTLIVAVAAIVVGDDRYDDVDALAGACAGAVKTRQLEHALFNMRARSEGGLDPICSPPEYDDDSDAVMLSRSPGNPEGRRRLGAFGERARR
jgi:hypothetical protein